MDEGWRTESGSSVMFLVGESDAEMAREHTRAGMNAHKRDWQALNNYESGITDGALKWPAPFGLL
jgi:hypothetical protein